MIRLEHVLKSFGARKVLNDVSMEIRRGEAFGIVGKSGTGKSVTLQLMIGLLAADRGRVLLDGKDIAQMDRKSLLEARKKIGFLFQAAALFDSLCVRDNVAFPLRRHTRKGKRSTSWSHVHWRKWVSTRRAIRCLPSCRGEWKNAPAWREPWC